MAEMAVIRTGRGSLGPLLAMAGVSVIWGVAFPLTKSALTTIPPFTFALLRFGAALAVLLPVSGRAALALLRGRDRWRFIVMGLLGYGVAQLALTLALSLSPAADISLLSIASPLWIALLAWLWLGERLGRRSALGFALAIGGLLLIVWPHGQAAAGGGARLLGDAIFLVNGLAWAGYNIMGKAMMARHSPLPATTAAVMAGFVGLLPFAAGEWLAGRAPQLAPLGVVAVLYSGLLVTVLGSLTLLWAYGRVRAAQVAITMYLQPLAGVVVAWALLHEPLSGAFLAGTALVFGGVWVVTTKRHA